MNNLTEAQLYNLMGRSGVGSSQLLDAIVRMMVLHLHRDHEYGVRRIAQSLGIKQKQVQAILELKNEQKDHN